MNKMENNRASSGRSRLLFLLLGTVLIVILIGGLSLKSGQDSSDQVIQDIQIIVGGNFSPDHLGPEQYQLIIDRVLARPDIYLDEFTRMYLGVNYRVTEHLDLNIPQLLIVVSKSDSEQVNQRVEYLAELLISHYSNILKIYEPGPEHPTFSSDLSEETHRYLNNLKERRIDLQLLLGQTPEEATNSTD